MLRNYLKLTLRTLWRNPLYSGLNLVGLTLGLTCALLIIAYVADELGYDRFHENADRIVLLRQFEGTGMSGGKLATDFKERFAQVENTVRLKQTTPLLTSTEASYYEENFFFADSSAFAVFTFPLVQGNPATALAERYGVVLSEAMANKYFPNQNPLGQTLRYDNKHTLRVTGVMRDLPGNSHHKIDFLSSYASANELMGWDVTGNLWGGATWTYLLLAPGATLASVEAQLPAYVQSLNDPNAVIWKLGLTPLTDLYLRTDYFAPNRLMYATIFSVVALLILLMAAFNYINLSTATAAQRAREVGVRKALGSTAVQLRVRFFGETVLFLSTALALTLLLIPLVLPAFNELANKKLNPYWLFTPGRGVVFAAGVVVLAGLAGGYPALVLSSFRPALVLKGNLNAGSGGRRSPRLRQVLVVSQFAVSIVMLVATLVVYKQIRYVQNKDLGYEREQVVVLNLHDVSPEVKQRFKKEIQQLSGVVSATQSFSVPGSGALLGEKLVADYAPKGAKDLSISRQTVDENFLKTYGIRLVQGRNLDPNRPDDRRGFLINEAAMRYFGWKSIEGKMVGYYTFEYDNTGNYREVPQRGPVLGVVADYHQKNLKNTIPPMLFSLVDGWESQLSVRLRAGNIPATMDQVKSLWERSIPTAPLDYEFLDDFFQRTYQSDRQAGQIFGWFASLAVLISVLGLFGLGMFAAERRTKEIGIRKVMGASPGSILILLSTDFLKLVLVAVLIATPIAFYTMEQWLQDFAYRTQVSWWIFAVAGVMALTIALLSVSYQSIKAALMNPVKSLRSE
jgi:putative ABC transport system permease protein